MSGQTKLSAFHEDQTRLDDQDDEPPSPVEDLVVADEFSEGFARIPDEDLPDGWELCRFLPRGEWHYTDGDPDKCRVTLRYLGRRPGGDVPPWCVSTLRGPQRRESITDDAVAATIDVIEEVDGA